MPLGLRWPFRRTTAPAGAAGAAPAVATKPPAVAVPSLAPARPAAGPPPLDATFAASFRARADARDAGTVLGPWGGLGETARFAVTSSRFADDAFVTQRWSGDIAARAEPLVTPDTGFAAGLATLASYREPSAAPGEDGSVFAATLPVAGGGVFATAAGSAPPAIARTPDDRRAPARASAAAIEAAIRAAEAPAGGGGFSAPRAATRSTPAMAPPSSNPAAPRAIARTPATAPTTGSTAPVAGQRARTRISEPPSSRDTPPPPVAAAATAAPNLPLAAAAPPAASATSAAIARESDAAPLLAVEPEATPDRGTPGPGSSPLPLAVSGPAPAASSDDAVARTTPATPDAIRRAIAAAEAPSQTPPAAQPRPTTAGGTAAPPPAAITAAQSAPSSGTAAPGADRRIARTTDTAPPLRDTAVEAAPTPPGVPAPGSEATLPLAAPRTPATGDDASHPGPAPSRAEAVQRAIAAAEAPAASAPAPGGAAGVQPRLARTAPASPLPPVDAAPPSPARPRRFAIGEPVAGDLPFARPPAVASTSPAAATATTVARRSDPIAENAPDRPGLPAPGSGPRLVLARTPAPAPIESSGSSDAGPVLSPQAAPLALFRVADDAPLPIEPPPPIPAAGPQGAAPLVRAASDSAPAALARAVAAGGAPSAAPGAGVLPFAAPTMQPFETTTGDGGSSLATTAFATGGTLAGGSLPLQRYIAPATPVVQRVTAEAEPMEGEVPAASGTVVAAESAGAPPAEPDLDRLTEKVWQRIRRTLQLERERRRGLP